MEILISLSFLLSAFNFLGLIPLWIRQIRQAANLLSRMHRVIQKGKKGEI